MDLAAKLLFAVWIAAAAAQQASKPAPTLAPTPAPHAAQAFQSTGLHPLSTGISAVCQKDTGVTCNFLPCRTWISGPADCTGGLLRNTCKCRAPFCADESGNCVKSGSCVEKAALSVQADEPTLRDEGNRTDDKRFITTASGRLIPKDLADIKFNAYLANVGEADEEEDAGEGDERRLRGSRESSAGVCKKDTGKTCNILPCWTSVSGPTDCTGGFFSKTCKCKPGFCADKSTGNCVKVVSRCNDCGAPIRVGPILVVYLTYQGTTPQKTVEQVRQALFGTPGYADLLNKASWGKTTLVAKDVDIFEMESSVDPDTWGCEPSLPTVIRGVTSQQSYKKHRASLESMRGERFKLTMLIVPGSTFQATAQVPGVFSRYRGDSITWQTIAHELGHNWGLLHAGGYYINGEQQTFEQYADDALLGYQRARRQGDFTAVARYNLGWIPLTDVASYPSTTQANIRALNEGPRQDGAKSIMVLPCSACRSTGYGCTGGNIFVSFRVQDPENLYGVELDDHLTEYKGRRLLKLVDRVHLHFQCSGHSGTELWTTLDDHTTFKAPDASLWIHVCKIHTNVASEFAVVRVSTVSHADASSQCPLEHYIERPLVAVEGNTVGSIEPLTSIDACKRACESNIGCNSFAVCRRARSGCWMKDRVVTMSDATSSSSHALETRQCTTFFKAA